MKLPHDTADPEGPNMTPVIDVVFLLLIFFLVATQFAKDEREMSVNLPEVTHARPISQASEMVINILPDGRYVVAQQELDERQLAALIAKAKRNNPHQKAVVRGDGESALKYAARALSLCDDVEMTCLLAVEENE